MDAVLQHQRRDVGVVDHVAGCAPTVEHGTEMASVGRSLSQQDERRRSEE